MPVETVEVKIAESAKELRAVGTLQSNESVVVMVDRCEPAEDIDAAEHEAARDAARAQLEALPEGDEHARQRDELEQEIGVAEVFIDVARR